MFKTAFGKDQLKSFIARIERLEEEKKSIAADIKEVFAEAKGTGFCTKTMRKIIALRKLDKADYQEQEAMLDLYKEAVGLTGTPLGEYDRIVDAVEKAGPRVPDVQAFMTEHEKFDPETGELTEQSSEKTSYSQREPRGEQQRDTLGVTAGENAPSSVEMEIPAFLRRSKQQLDPVS